MRTAAAGVLAVALAVGAPVGSAAGGRDSASAEHKPVRVSATATDLSPDDLPFPHHRLRSGSPAEAELLARPLQRMSADLRSYLEPSPTRPMYAGGVVLASRHGVVPVHDAAGKAVRYADAETELPVSQQVPMRRDTIFDLASVTKTFTTIAVMQQVEAGLVDLDEPVATYLPDFAANGKDDVTVRHLLTHTGGLPAWLPLYSAYPTREDRLAAVLAVKPTAEPEQKYVYSDLGLITLGLLVEEVTREPLDAVISDGITGPLGMTDTMFNPPARLVDRIAATEAQPWAGRPMIRGEVHDENSWSLGGVAGHAGLFSTAHDLAVLARTLLNGGRYGTAEILEPETVRAMLVNENTEFPANSHGLGFELDQRWYMDGLSTPATFGHTGYTGTSVVIDPLSDSFVILLTNRVHPSRDWGSNNPSRRAMARDLARAIAVPPLEGDTAWFSGVGDARTVSLTTPALTGRTLSFGLWYDTEAGFDVLTLEASTDEGETWSRLPFTMRGDDDVVTSDGTVSGFGGRVWHDATATLPWPTPSSCGGATPATRPSRAAASTSTGCASTGSRWVTAASRSTAGSGRRTEPRVRGLVGDAEGHQGQPRRPGGRVVGRPRRAERPRRQAVGDPGEHRPGGGEQGAGQHDGACRRRRHRVERGQQAGHTPPDDVGGHRVAVFGVVGHQRRQRAEGRGRDGVRPGDHVLHGAGRTRAQQRCEERLGHGRPRPPAVEAGHHGDQRLAGQPHRRADVTEQPPRAVGLPYDPPVDDRRRTGAGATDQHDAGRPGRPGGERRQQVGDDDRVAAQSSRRQASAASSSAWASPAAPAPATPSTPARTSEGSWPANAVATACASRSTGSPPLERWLRPAALPWPTGRPSVSATRQRVDVPPASTPITSSTASP